MPIDLLAFKALSRAFLMTLTALPGVGMMRRLRYKETYLNCFLSRTAKASWPFPLNCTVFKNTLLWEFSGGPVVRILGFRCRRPV